MTAIDALATKLSGDHSLGKFLSARPISGGEVNQVYLLETDLQKVVLRLNEHGEYPRFRKEEWAARAAVGHGIPTPQVLHVGQDGIYAYMLLEYVAGKNGNDIDSTPELWRKLGIALRLIHRVPVKGFGENLDDVLEGDVSQWQRYLTYNIGSLTEDDTLIAQGILDSNTSQKLRAIFEGLSATNFTFGLNHGDYSLSNVIVDGSRTPQIIDWGSAQAHIVPHHDLGVIVDESLDDGSEEFRALLEGYGMSLDEYKAMKADITNLYLLEMTDKLRWAFDKSPTNIPYYTKQLQKYLTRL